MFDCGSLHAPPKGVTVEEAQEPDIKTNEQWTMRALAGSGHNDAGFATQDPTPKTDVASYTQDTLAADVSNLQQDAHILVHCYLQGKTCQLSTARAPCGVAPGRRTTATRNGNDLLCRVPDTRGVAC